jgi:hypothetical protein
MMVLAPWALEIAGERGEGQSNGAGMEVKERLYLDRSRLDGGDVSVGMSEQSTVSVLSHLAEPFLTRGDDAASIAEGALNVVVRKSRPKLRGVVHWITEAKRTIKP